MLLNREYIINPDDNQLGNRRGHKNIYTVKKRFDLMPNNMHQARSKVNVVGEYQDVKNFRIKNPEIFPLYPPVSNYQSIYGSGYQREIIDPNIGGRKNFVDRATFLLKNPHLNLNQANQNFQFQERQKSLFGINQQSNISQNSQVDIQNINEISAKIQELSLTNKMRRKNQSMFNQNDNLEEQEELMNSRNMNKNQSLISNKNVQLPSLTHQNPNRFQQRHHSIMGTISRKNNQQNDLLINSGSKLLLQNSDKELSPFPNRKQEFQSQQNSISKMDQLKLDNELNFGFKNQRSLQTLGVENKEDSQQQSQKKLQKNFLLNDPIILGPEEIEKNIVLNIGAPLFNKNYKRWHDHNLFSENALVHQIGGAKKQYKSQITTDSIIETKKKLELKINEYKMKIDRQSQMQLQIKKHQISEIGDASTKVGSQE